MKEIIEGDMIYIKDDDKFTLFTSLIDGIGIRELGTIFQSNFSGDWMYRQTNEKVEISTSELKKIYIFMDKLK